MANNFYSKVFGWFFIGLLITGLSGVFVINNGSLVNFIFNSSGYFILIIVQIIIALILSIRIYKMSPNTAKILYILYAILTGCTLSSIFLIFEIESIIYILFVTGILFGIFALLGKTAKIDLSRIGIFLFIGLLGIIILEIINLFIMNNTLNMITCIIALVIFLGYVAFDIQKIKRIAENGYWSDNLAIIGAFQLYLDIVNIFIELLNLFGKRRN